MERERERKIDTMEIAGEKTGLKWSGRGACNEVKKDEGEGACETQPGADIQTKREGETPPSAREKPHDGGEAG